MTIRKHSRGMGLIMVLLLILGLSLSATVVFVSAGFQIDQSNVKLTQEKMKKLALAISSTSFTGVTKSQRSYEQDVLVLPTAGLNGLLTRPGGVAVCSYSATTRRLTGWCGPYWIDDFSGESSFADAWGRTITYDNAGRRIYSWGPNGTNNSGAGDDLVQTF